MQLKSIILGFLGLLSAATANNPIKLTAGYHGTAVEVDQQDVRLYYQVPDTSVLEIGPNFPAGKGYFGPGEIISAGTARNNTALAAIVLQSNGWFGEASQLSFTRWISKLTRGDQIHLYYFGTAYNNQQLCEKVWDSTGWHDGSLNGMAYTSAPGQQFLYAITDGNNLNAAYTIRVGFACEGAPMCEAYYSSSSKSWDVGVVS